MNPADLLYDYPAGPKQLDDGRVSWVIRMTFGKGRLIVGTAPVLDDPRTYTCDDGWCFDSLALAVAEHERWNGDGEPAGWMRHPLTGRRRPGGDAAAEYVAL